MTMAEPVRRYQAKHTLDSQLAGYVRERFIVCYRQKAVSLGRDGKNWLPSVRWDGGSRNGRTYRSIWLRCVPVFQQHQLLPAEYVHFVVFDLSPLGLPDPTELLSKAAITAFHHNEMYEWNRRLERHRVSLQGQMTALRAYTAKYCNLVESGALSMPTDQLRRVGLQNLESALTPLFRYCVAYREGMPDIYDNEPLQEAAASQYVFESRLLNTVWGELIPEDFRKRAMRMFGL